MTMPLPKGRSATGVIPSFAGKHERQLGARAVNDDYVTTKGVYITQCNHISNAVCAPMNDSMRAGRRLELSK
jgi:hypothetical protein